MRVATENSLLFDDSDPDCSLVFSRTHGHAFAFIQCLDIGKNGKSRRIKRYWGFYADSSDEKKNEQSIYHIMNSGSSWPDIRT